MENICENDRGAHALGNSSPCLKAGGSLPQFAEPEEFYWYITISGGGSSLSTAAGDIKGRSNL